MVLPSCSLTGYKGEPLVSNIPVPLIVAAFKEETATGEALKALKATQAEGEKKDA